MTTIHPFSTSSLYIEPYHDDIKLSSATGFIITHKEKDYIVTNWHVVKGIDPSTNRILSETGLLPNKLKVYFRGENGIEYKEIFQNLYDESSSPLWNEHPLGKNVDVILLPFESNSEVIRYAFNIEGSDQSMLPQPGMHVSIIGFPLGISNRGYFPVWKGGYIATDPDLNFNELPLILIDSTTREGMSGSPVFVTSANYLTKTGQPINGRTSHLFLGIYSGRENNIAELGRVWKAEVVEQILLNC